MKILGIHDGHTASAAVVIDGKTVAAVSEERLRMEKNWNGFPVQSIDYLLKMTGLQPHEIDFLAYNGYHIPPGMSRDESLESRRRNTGWYGKMLQATRQTPIMAVYKNRRREKRLEQALSAGFPENKVKFVEHHMAHAAAAYYGWGKYDEPILVLTADGAGDELCASVNIGRDGKLERIASIGRSESLGSLYSSITFYLGMVPLEHEYKLMGLAPYADEKRGQAVADILFEYMPLPADGCLTWQRNSGSPPAPIIYPYLRKHLEFHRFDSIAAGIQLYTEKMLEKWVKNAIAQTGIRKVALSGGVFMNVKANKLIMELPEVEDLFVFPSCGDETNAMGAAYWVEAEQGNPNIPPIEEFYYGADFDPVETVNAVEKRSAGTNWTVQHLENTIDDHIADLLAEGEIVARARGKMEFGARALGNRSILADPTKPRVVETINYMVKQRDFWMPFAPMILDSRASDYLVNPKNIRAPYMIMSFDTPPEVRDQMTAAIHPYDRTARPQVLEEKHNPNMYRILKRFEEKTGRGVILNTSFNLHGYPIVGTPDAAIDVFEKSGLPHLAVGDYLISKNEG